MAYLFKDCPNCGSHAIHQCKSKAGWRTFCAECWTTTEEACKSRESSMRQWNSGRRKPLTR